MKQIRFIFGAFSMHILPFVRSCSFLLLALLTACSSNESEIQGYCLEFESTDINGNPENAFFAYNVKTFQEGKDLLDNWGSGQINEAIHENPCNQNIGVCTQVWKPVCAITESGRGVDLPKTYSNLCMLKSEVKKLSGSSSKAKAHFDDGDCNPD